MRIGLVVYGSLDVVSGGNLYDRMLVEHLREHSHDVEILSLPSRSYAGHLLDNFSNRLRQKLRRAEYDILLQDELAHPSLFRLNRWLGPRVGYPLVSIVHHLRSSEDRPDWQNDLYRRVERQYLGSVDAMILNSHTTRESVELVLQKKTWNVVATPGGNRFPETIAPEEVPARARAEGALKLLFVGNLIARKGLHDLLTSLSALTEQAWHLDVVGSLEMDPSYVAQIQSQIDELGFRERLTLHGNLDGEALVSRFRENQLLVVPSTYEGFGIVYLEARGGGVPVIASSAGATDEIVVHEGTGFLVTPGDTFSLTRQLERLMEDRNLLATMSLAAFEGFRHHDTWQDSMNAIERFLREVLADRLRVASKPEEPKP